MKVKFEREKLVDAVSTTLNTVSTVNTNEADKGIRITAREDGTCLLESFDLEKGIQYPLLAEVERPGSYIIDGKLLYNIIKNLDEDITVDINEKKVALITSGDRKSQVNALDGDLFSNPPMMVGDYHMTVVSSELRASLAEVDYAIAVNDTRAVLKGMYLHAEPTEDGKILLTTAATDAFRLAVDKKIFSGEISLDTEFSGILPRTAVGILRHLLPEDATPVEVLATYKHMIFKTPHFTLFTRLIDGQYVDFMRFVPKDPKIFAVMNCAEFLSAIESAAVFADDSSSGKATNYITMEFRPDQLVMNSATVRGSARVIASCALQGESLRMGMNSRYLADCIRAMKSDAVRIAISGPITATVMYPLETISEEEQKKRTEATGVSEETRFHLVVPIRLKD